MWITVLNEVKEMSDGGVQKLKEMIRDGLQWNPAPLAAGHRWLIWFETKTRPKEFGPHESINATDFMMQSTPENQAMWTETLHENTWNHWLMFWRGAAVLYEVYWSKNWIQESFRKPSELLHKVGRQDFIHSWLWDYFHSYVCLDVDVVFVQPTI